MSDMQVRLGHSLLKSLVDLRQQKGDLSLEDVGSMFMRMASTLNHPTSATDRFMHEEIARLAKYITEAKQEIFAISTTEKSEKALVDASEHLDEVIKHTEEATNTIMDAADTIQNNVSGIGGEKEQAIMDAAMRIYEACNFQDITGQRIRKVIKLLTNIEDHVEKLNDLFGAEEDAIEKSAANSNGEIQLPADDKDLLNGPQLKKEASTQADIDALFAGLAGKA